MDGRGTRALFQCMLSFAAEYIGEIVSDTECEAREAFYEHHGIADYMFR
jgi:hypothetical protein